MDHLKTTVIALNEKAEIIGDMRNDVAETRNQYEQCDVARVELQVHIKETSITIAKDNEEHKQYQTELIEKYETAQAEIKRMNEDRVKRERVHRDGLEKVNLEKEELRKQKDAELR